jgi:spiro-SPASM protein
VVSIGLFGEPFLCPDINEIIDRMKNYPAVQFILESRCLFNNTDPIQKALELPNVKIIFDVSASSPETFQKIKKPMNPIIPFEGLASIEEKIKGLPDKEKIYIQFTRTTGNEDELMKFYERWRDFSDRIIIKKPDTFGGILNEFRVVDLSPVERFPCLHLKHDMVILADGDVPICRQDYNCAIPAGNILKDGIASCWEKLLPHYEAQWQGRFDKPPLCKDCDEWWVFNF